MAQTVFKRYEMKYLLNADQYAAVKRALIRHAVADVHGRSEIRNIYYDTPDFLLVRRSIERPIYKEKLRVRCYGRIKEGGEVFVELKKKYDGVVFKRRVVARQNEAKGFLNGKVKLPDCQILREIDYFCKRYAALEPKVMLTYDREAYYDADDPDLRITFDTNILFRTTDLDLTSPTGGRRVIGRDRYLMEIKTAVGLPLWLVQVLTDNKIVKTSFSKYGEAYKTIMNETTEAKNVG